MAISLVHLPEGDGNPYEAVPWSRHPLEPAAGQRFRVGARVDGGSSPVVVEWESAARRATVTLSQVGDSWTGEVGPFEADCRYRFTAGTVTTDWFTVPIGRWSPIEFAHVDTDAERICVTGDRGHALELTPRADGTLAWSLGPAAYRSPGARSVRLGAWSVRVDETGAAIVTDGDHRLRLGGMVLEHGPDACAWQLWWVLQPEEHIFGTGERYDSLDQRGRQPDIRVYEQYKGQGSRTYFPVPWLISTQGYGLAVDGSSRIGFDLGSSLPDRASATVPSPNGASGRWYFGTPRQMVGSYTSDLGSRSSLPMWAFGPWMSGNEWDSEQRVREVVEQTLEEGMPATVLVIEAWSDEATFYLFNDTEYEPAPGAQPVGTESMRHGGRWPDPKAMVEWLHDRDIRVLLWQIPVLKDMEGHEQQERDVAFAEQAGLCVRTSDGAPYRNRGWWFPRSHIIDFTNADATEWWFAKRAYLLDEVGVDGFKTDGGEHLWGRDVVVADGATGHAAANAYPTQYLAAYHQFLGEHGHEQPLTFSRAGFTGSQGLPAHWAGDEDSTWAALRASLTAGLSAGVSGVAYWGWDLAGFSGELPSAELYKRSTAFAAFCPIMQYHSEHNEHREPLADRTPWNVGRQRSDPGVNEVYRFYARLRMNLVPYLFGVGVEAARTGLPMMRAMALEFPADPVACAIDDQFLVGSDLLIAPVLEPGRSDRRVYLPDGAWIDFWSGQPVPSGWVSAKATVDAIPAYVRGGACIPLWMPAAVELGAEVGLPGDGEGRLVLMVAPGTCQSLVVDPLSAHTWTVTVEPEEEALHVRVVDAPDGVSLWSRAGIGGPRLVSLPVGDSELRIGPES